MPADEPVVVMPAQDSAFQSEDASAADAQISQLVGVPEGVEIVDATGAPTGEVPVYEHNDPNDPTRITGWHKAPAESTGL